MNDSGEVQLKNFVIQKLKIGDQYCKDVSDLQNDNVW